MINFTAIVRAGLLATTLLAPLFSASAKADGNDGIVRVKAQCRFLKP